MKNICPIALGTLIGAILLCQACIPTQTPETAIAENEALLCRLDSLIAHRDTFIVRKERKIEQLKRQLAHIDKAEQQHTCLQELYWAYRVYDADSAMKYITLYQELAQRHHQSDWETEALLDLSFIYTANGLLDQAEKTMGKLEGQALSREMRSRYYGQMRTLCSRLQLYAQGDEKLQEHYGHRYALYSDSVLQTATPNEPRYLYCKVWKYQDDPERRKEVIQELETQKELLTANSRNYSILAYNLASLYEKEGNLTLWLKNLILSGMADVRAVNRDIGSLHAIASYLYNNGELERSYRYCTYLQDIGTAYKSRVRLLHLSELQNQIQQSYIRRDHERTTMLKKQLLMISILSVILAITLFFLLRQTGKRREANRLLHQANEKLKEMNRQLQTANSDLLDANYIKEEYIGQVFKLCSTYIQKMEDYRKKLNRKMKAGQMDDLKRILDSNLTDSSEMKVFYEMFDSIILNLYPNFVCDINQLLRPEEHIAVKEGRLNTELRIQALIRLGVTDSEKIAEFLHCSLQTVYNNRSMTASKATCGKEAFMQAVKQLGKAPSNTSLTATEHV